LADRPRVGSDAEILPAALAERVLKRASELDAVRAGGSAVAELRAAAAEAGISADAFDAALGELQKADQVPAPVPAVSTRRWRGLFFGLATLGAFFLLLAAVFIPMRLAAPAPAALVSQTIQLKCLSADQALDLIRPLLTDRTTTVRTPNSTSTFIIRGTPEQVKTAQAAIDKVDDGQACIRK
jgi:hypothetical protein